MNFTNKKMRISSPSSKRALLILGLNESDLFEISLKEYLDRNPELKNQSQELQNKRYEHFNERRLNSIEEARQLREDIIQEKGNSRKK